MKSDDRRAAILDRLADHVLAHGLSAASLRPLAKAAQTSDRMLLYYFKDKAEIIAATLDQVSLRLVALLEDQTAKTPLPLADLRTQLLTLLFAERLWPYMRIWLEVAALAARGDPVYRDVGERIARGFLAWGAAQLDSPTPDAREADAARLMVTIEGMLLMRSVGLEDVCRKAL
ncbi:TetR/AcrR family transcriptional regulator [Phenylobacterium sp.]|uniref:TetR/AcrR family transcriptional regulator n=1 Tax=Phenylobacterium sp. TaxID=1871053 RepID=UPI00286BA8F1|nr:TetR/AcrR family transcriptional regulator [Phenylobacterium sp.]